MARPYLAALVLAVAPLLVACPSPAGYRCAADEDCGPGRTCAADRTCQAAPDGASEPPADAPPRPIARMCVPGIELTGGDPCIETVCAREPACCAVSWDEGCVLAAEAACDLPCTQVAALGGYLGAGAGRLAGSTYQGLFSQGNDGWTYEVAWGDLDSDGVPDLAIAQEAVAGGPGVVILRGGGLAGSNLTLSPVAIGGDAVGSTIALAWRDFDNDDDLDLLAGGDGGAYLIEAEAGAYRAHRLTATPVTAVAWADSDGAAPWPLVLAYPGQPVDSDDVLVRHQLSGNRTIDAVSAGNTIATSQADDLVWCDVTNDGRRDLLVGQFSRVRLLPATASGFGPPQVLAVEGTRIACGDLDGDGDNDLVAGRYGLAPQVVENAGGVTGDPRWSGTTTLLTRGIDLGDLDQDGDLDVVLAAESPGAAPLMILRNGGTPGPAWFTVEPGPDWNGASRDAKGVDLGPLPR